MNKVVETGMKIDLHIHSVASKHKDGQKVESGTIENVKVLAEKLNEKAVDICAITDHDVFDYQLYSKLKELESDDSSTIRKVLPGVEFSVEFQGDEAPKTVHIIVIFNDSVDDKVKEIQKVLGTSPRYDQQNAFGHKRFVEILDEISLDTLMIVHQKGSLMSEGKPRANDANSLGAVAFNELLTTEYFEAYEFKNRANEVYNRIYAHNKGINKSLRLVTGSDCHEWSAYPGIDCTTGDEHSFTYVKCLPTFKGLAMAFTDNRRIKLVNSFFNPRATSCEEVALTIDAAEIKIPLSRGINAIIGDNSIGKSLLLHALNGNRSLQNKPKLLKGYEKYLKDIGASIETSLSETSVFHFDAQGEIKAQFEEMDSQKSNKILKEHFPDPINIDEYRRPLLKTVDSYCESLSKQVQYNEECNTQQIFRFFIESGKASNITFISSGFSKPETKQLAELVAKFGETVDILQSLIWDYSGTIDDEDIKQLETYINTIKDMKDKYEKRLSKMYLESAKISIVQDCIKEAERELKKIISDEQKETAQFYKDIDSAADAIVNLKKMQLSAREPSIIVEEKRIVPNRNTVREYVFVAKVSVEKIPSDYINSTISKVLKKRKMIDWKADIESSLKDKILQYPTDRTDVVAVFKEKIYGHINKDFESKLSVTKNNVDVYSELSAGVNAQIYFSLVTDVSRNLGVYFIDQPEDQISQPAIKDVVLGCFKDIGESRQVLLVTHNPQFIVNLDVDNVIFLFRDKNGKLCVQSGALEYECSDYSMLQVVANNVEGGIDTIRRRMRRYEKAL
jgi:predicted ATPase